jgi:N-methylhydantoinase B
MNADLGRQNFDPIIFQVLWSRLINIVDEMAVTLEKTAFSHVVRDNHDYACALYDSRGEMLVQATTSTPGQLGSMTRFMRDLLEEYPTETLEPGDILITNDPWLGSGHTPDIYITTPVFQDDRLVGFACNSAHHVDIGGRIASPEAREVYEEGIILPIAKLYSRGVPNQDIFKIIERNVRVSDKVIGDLRAQIAANHVGHESMCQLMRERDLHTLTELSSQILDQTEASLRAAIAEVPDGVFTHRMELEDKDQDGNPIVINTSVEIKGDTVHVDYTGSSDQVHLPINCVFNITFAYTMFALKCLLRPHIPNNAGCFRPIQLSAPEGSILNAKFPVAVWWRTDVVYYLTEAIFGALVKCIPEKVMAASGTYPLWLTIFSGEFQDGRPYVLHFNASGGQGARSYMDGPSTMVFPGNIANTPIELLETESTVLCEKKTLVPGSGGPGKHRGGLGQDVVLRNIADSTVAGTVVGGRYRNGPVGFSGGLSGTKGVVQVNEEEPFSRSKQVLLHAGDRLRLRLPGGGGFGDPLERDVQLVLDDVRQGLVSPEEAREFYGVALQPDTLELDHAETASLRGGEGRPR